MEIYAGLDFTLTDETGPQKRGMDIARDDDGRFWAFLSSDYGTELYTEDNADPEALIAICVASMVQAGWTYVGLSRP